MRRIALVLTVALLMVAMLAIPAMASNGADASGGAACNFGTETAHSSLPLEPGPADTGHENIPECVEE